MNQTRLYALFAAILFLSTGNRGYQRRRLRSYTLVVLVLVMQSNPKLCYSSTRSTCIAC
jgi:hypothetical protein